MKKSKNILLIGSESGIGLQIKKDLINRNNLFCTTSKKVKNKNYLNFKEKQSIKKSISKAYKKFPFYDYIIFNSFISNKRKEFKDYTLKKFTETINTNISAHLLISKLILHYQSKNIKLIFISTEAVKNNSWGLSQYTIAKSAIETFLKTLSIENKNIETKILRLKKYNTPGYLRVNGQLLNTKDAKLASSYILKKL